MKRVTSVLIALIITLASVIPLTGCQGKSEDTISWGQWLTMIDDAFGMESYTTEAPYYSNIQSTDTYFDAVQIAVEWGVVSPEIPLNTEEKITWKNALVTLVNAGNFMESETSDTEKVDYACENFDTEVRSYWLERNITYEKATLLLGIAQQKWASQKYDHVVEEITYKKDVLDFTQKDTYIDDYSVMEDGTIVIPKKYGVQLQKDDVFVLPSTDDNVGILAHKVQEIDDDDNNVYIKAAKDELELEDIAEELFIEETYIPSMENAVVYDGNGKVVSVGDNISSYMRNKENGDKYICERDSLVCKNNQEKGMNLANQKISHTFTIDGCEVALEYKLDGAFDLKASVKSDNILNSDKNGTLKVKGSVEVSQLEVTNKIDYSFPKLKSAILKVDYTQKNTLEAAYQVAPVNMVAAPKMSNGNGHFWTNVKNSVFKAKDAAGAKTIKIASVNVYSIGLARVCLDINAKISLDGSVTIEVTEHGTKGLEYRNNNLRVINVCDKDSDLSLKGKAEFTLGVGPALYTVGLKKPIIGLQVAAGIGGMVKITVHIADTENHLLEECSEDDVSVEMCEAVGTLPMYAEAQAIESIARAQGSNYTVETSGDVQIHPDICMDVTGYFILKLELTDTSYVGKLMGGKIQVKWTIFDEKNAKFFNAHLENGEWVGVQWGNWSGSMCTKEYKPFESVVTETEEADNDNVETAENSIEVGENLLIDCVKMTLEENQKRCILLQQLPINYSIADISYMSSDEKIAVVGQNGEVVGVGAGSTIITVYTKDNKYKAYCAVTVTGNEKIEITPIKWEKEKDSTLHL